MSLDLTTIQKPIEAELREFETHFNGALQSRVMLLNTIMKYVIRRKGKQMRPMFVLLSANLCGGINPSTYRAAALIELLHTATLIHDDVVDDSDQRRGFFSLNALWKNKIAVLIGDFLLSRGLLMAVEAGDFEFLRITSKAVKLMSEGELLQIEKARALNIDEPVYLDIIRQKTASLIASCCESGASSATQNTAQIEAMRHFGELVGMAFQIKDDLFDYGYGAAGKPVGNDIQEKKMTLPLIHALNQASWLDRRKMISIVRNHNREARKVKWLVEAVKQAGGLEYSHARMLEFSSQALEVLHGFPVSASRTSLEQLVTFTIERNK
jgi:octaprenyl-diphosphate synthase